ncbi:unnamed protein product [Urochloa humidicola]
MVARKLVVSRHTVRVAVRAVRTTVTARPAVARRWLHTAFRRCRRALRFAPGLTVVGLGVQWTPPFGRLPGSTEPRPATLQLCTGNYCLVYQLARAGVGAAVPRILRRFLAGVRVMFAGYNVGSDCRKLRAHHGLEVGSVIELRGIAGVGGNASMADMAEKLLGIRGVVKSRDVATGEWERKKMSYEQVRYAVVDAYLSCCLGVYLCRRAMESYVLQHSDDEDDDSNDEDGKSTSSEASSDWG